MFSDQICGKSFVVLLWKCLYLEFSAFLDKCVLCVEEL